MRTPECRGHRRLRPAGVGRAVVRARRAAWRLATRAWRGCRPRGRAAAPVRRAGSEVDEVVAARAGPAELPVALAAVADHAVQRVDRLVGEHAGQPGQHAPEQRRDHAVGEVLGQRLIAARPTPASSSRSGSRPTIMATARRPAARPTQSSRRPPPRRAGRGCAGPAACSSADPRPASRRAAAAGPRAISRPIAAAARRPWRVTGCLTPACADRVIAACRAAATPSAAWHGRSAAIGCGIRRYSQRRLAEQGIGQQGHEKRRQHPAGGIEQHRALTRN